MNELVQWMSLLDEAQDEVSEITSLPALQGLLERMESQAGRVVANELMAIAEEGGYGALDEIGRNKLRQLCNDFSKVCTKVSAEDELNALHWRIQALTRKPVEEAADDDVLPDASQPRTTAVLRVPTNRKAETWWNPEYWPIARPTDFCYGDCVWGMEHQKLPLSVIDWIVRLYRLEEMEYSLPDEEIAEELFEAAPINRFRSSWYDLHLTHSFWRVTETSKSVHTFMKTPGAYGYAKACAYVTPEMLEEMLLKAQQGGSRPSLQSMMADKNLPQQLRVALTSLHQATGSLIGSDGHRRLLQKEGVAYTLRFGPALIFTTPNLADTKQPLLLVVQGEEFSFESDVEASFCEMTGSRSRRSDDCFRVDDSFVLRSCPWYTRGTGLVATRRYSAPGGAVGIRWFGC